MVEIKPDPAPAPAPVAATPNPPVAPAPAPQAAPQAPGTKQAFEKVDQFAIDFAEEPLSLNPVLELQDNKPIWVEIKGGFPVRPGIRVKIEGFYVDPWVSDPSKSKKNAVAPQTAPAPQTAGSGEKEVAPLVLDHAEEEAETENEWSQWEIRDPKTNKSIRFSFRATALTELKNAQNDLPLKYRLKTMLDIDHQQWYNPANDLRKQYQRSVFGVQISPDDPDVDLKGTQNFLRNPLETGVNSLLHRQVGLKCQCERIRSLCAKGEPQDPPE